MAFTYQPGKKQRFFEGLNKPSKPQKKQKQSTKHKKPQPGRQHSFHQQDSPDHTSHNSHRARKRFQRRHNKKHVGKESSPGGMIIHIESRRRGAQPKKIPFSHTEEPSQRSSSSESARKKGRARRSKRKRRNPHSPIRNNNTITVASLPRDSTQRSPSISSRTLEDCNPFDDPFADYGSPFGKSANPSVDNSHSQIEEETNTSNDAGKDAYKEDHTSQLPPNKTKQSSDSSLIPDTCLPPPLEELMVKGLGSTTTITADRQLRYLPYLSTHQTLLLPPFQK